MISWIPQAQPGIVLLECPWDPLKKEGIEGHRQREGVGKREREREDPHLDRGSMHSHHTHAISQTVMARRIGSR